MSHLWLFACIDRLQFQKWSLCHDIIIHVIIIMAYNIKFSQVKAALLQYHCRINTRSWLTVVKLSTDVQQTKAWKHAWSTSRVPACINKLSYAAKNLESVAMYMVMLSIESEYHITSLDFTSGYWALVCDFFSYSDFTITVLLVLLW